MTKESIDSSGRTTRATVNPAISMKFVESERAATSVWIQHINERAPFSLNVHYYASKLDTGL